MASEPLYRIHAGTGRTDARSLCLQPDSVLLEHFIAHQDPEAFEVLVARHGSRVLRVCRQVLGSSSEAEDVFQATFMLLVRKAGSIRNRDSLGHWLHGVAHRLAVRCRARSARRRNLEQMAPLRIAEGTAETEVDVQELRRAMHEEIDRLPPRLRDPILLCYLEGRTNVEAARLLGCPPSTLKERLARGREVLQNRLARRGLALTSLLLLLLLPREAPAEDVPLRLVEKAKNALKRRPRGRSRPGPGSTPEQGPRLFVIAITASTILAFGTALALASPTKGQGAWLGRMIDAAKNSCH